MTDKTKEAIDDVLHDIDHGNITIGEARAKICAIVDEERKGEGWIKQDEVLEILARHEFPDNIDGVCDQNIELRLIAEEIESLPRHAAPSQEPLAVLADRKGWWITWVRDIFEDHKDKGSEWLIVIEKDRNGDEARRYTGPTYAAAETAARAYLEGLKDVEKGGD